MTPGALPACAAFAFLASPGLLPVATSSGPASQPAGSAPARLTVRGSELLAPGGHPIRLRGFNLLWWVPPTAQDAADIKELGANCVRYQFGYIPQGRLDLRQLRNVRRHIELFTSQGLWVIPNVHTFRSGQMPDEQNVWNSPELHREFLEMWSHLLGELKDLPCIAAWEPMNEPHHVPRERLAPWYREVIAHFRRIDPHTPLVVEGANYSGAEELLDSLKLDEPGLIYSFHFYHPHEYTHMRRPEGRPPQEYPGRWGRRALEERMSIAVRFRDRHQVPVFCGEWGVQTGAPGYPQWLEDVSSLLEQNAVPWAHWAWALQRRSPINDTFDCNRQKTEIYGLMKGVFQQALQGRQREAAVDPR